MDLLINPNAVEIYVGKKEETKNARFLLGGAAKNEEILFVVKMCTGQAIIAFPKFGGIAISFLEEEALVYVRGDRAGFSTVVTGIGHIFLLVRYCGAKNEVKRTVFGCIKLDNKRLIGIGGEVLTAVGHAVVVVLNGGYSCFQIQLSAILGDSRVFVSEIYVGLREVIKTICRK